MRPLVLLPLLLAACGPKEGPDDDPTGEPSVLILVLDGVRVEEWTSDWESDLTGKTGEAWADDAWRRFMRAGAVARAAVNPGVTITAPGHAAILTGRHDPLANFGVEDAGPGLYRPEHPTLFELGRSQLGLGAADAVLLANTELLMPTTASVYPGLGEGLGAEYAMVVDPERPAAPMDDDEPVVAELKALIDGGAPRMILVNLHDVDRAGHYGGDGAYVGDVEKLDGLLAELWRWMGDEHPDYVENLLVVLTADHGRHRHDGDDGWRNHGDACDGCREVPLALVGPGVSRDVELGGTYLLEDILPTLAAHLGIEAPLAQGLPLTPAFAALDAPARAGEVAVAAAGGRVAVQRWRDDFESRSEVVVDGEVLSTDGVLAAEAPVLIPTADGLIACFREITVGTEDTFWPWVGRCFREGDAGWAELPPLEASVAVDWQPAMVERDGTLYAAYAHNPDSIGELGADAHVGMRVRRFDGAGWSEPFAVNEYFPAHARAAATGDGLVVAFATNQGGDQSRYTRRVRVYHLVDDGSSLVREGTTDFTLEDVLGAGTRVERAALSSAGGRLSIALLGYSETAATVAVASSDDDGATWSAARALPGGDPPIPGISPVWDGDAVVWATQGADEAALCRATVDDPAATCVGLGVAHVDGLAAADGRVWVSAGDGGQWTVSEVAFP